MAASIWKPGRRLFSTAALLMILTSIAHTLGNIASRPETGAEDRVIAEMSRLRLPLGMGMNPSLMDIHWALVFGISVTFAALGAINLVLASGADTPERLLRRASWVNALWVGAFTIVAWAYRVPPPLIFGVLIEAFVLADLIVARRSVE